MMFHFLRSQFPRRLSTKSTPSSLEFYREQAHEIASSLNPTTDQIGDLAFKLYERDVATDKRQIKSYFSKKLSLMSQRYVFERFFKAVVQKYNDNESNTFMAIKSSKHASDFGKGSMRRFPSMSLVNRTLLDPAVWDAVDLDFKISTTEKKINVPVFPPSLMYGVASEWLHNSDIRNVIVSDLADENTKAFLGRLAEMNSLRLKEFDEVAAEAMAEELEKD